MEIKGCIIAIIVIAAFFLEGYVLMLLWNWLAPLFWSAAPILGFWECIGIRLLINLIGSILRSTLGLNKK
jgi:hypothetical protein